MGVQELIAAWPTEASGDPVDPDAARAELVAGYVGIIDTDTAVVTGVLQVDPLDADTGAVRQCYAYRDGIFILHPADETSVHDGLTTLVLSGGYRYIVQGGLRAPRAVESVGPAAEPSSPELGQAWIDTLGVIGSANDIIIWTSRGWEEVSPDYGPPIYVKDIDGYYRWTGDDGWQQGPGAGAIDDDSIPLSALIGLDASFIIKVENQTTYAPPGSRVSGGTPTMPLGGTAANINDDTDSTSATTGAMGDLTAVSLADRAIGRIHYDDPVDLIAIEARGVSVSTGSSSSNACGIYYSTDGSNFTQAGAGFTLNTTAQDVLRVGTFDGVTDIIVVPEAKNWSAATSTLKGLNGHDDTVVVAKGTSYIPAANAFGVFAGNVGKVMRAEAENVFTAYTPANMDTVADKSLSILIQWLSATNAWESASGAWVAASAPVVTRGSGSTSDVGSGSTYSTYSNTTPPPSSARKRQDDATITHAARKAGTNSLRFKWQGDLTTAVGGSVGSARDLVAALFVDNLTDAVDYCRCPGHDVTPAAMTKRRVALEFYASPADADPHTYRVAFVYPGGNPTNLADVVSVTTIENRKFSVEELA